MSAIAAAKLFQTDIKTMGDLHKQIGQASIFMPRPACDEVLAVPEATTSHEHGKVTPTVTAGVAKI